MEIYKKLPKDLKVLVNEKLRVKNKMLCKEIENLNNNPFMCDCYTGQSVHYICKCLIKCDFCLKSYRKSFFRFGKDFYYDENCEIVFYGIENNAVLQYKLNHCLNCFKEGLTFDSLRDAIHYHNNCYSDEGDSDEESD